MYYIFFGLHSYSQGEKCLGQTQIKIIQAHSHIFFFLKRIWFNDFFLPNGLMMLNDVINLFTF